MQNIIDALQAIARQRGRGDASPLIMLRQLDGADGERISHLPIEVDMSQAWLALMGEPFRPHQAQVVTALRRGEPVALCGSHPGIASTALLALYATLTSDPAAAAIVLAPDDAAASSLRTSLDHANENLPQHLRLGAALIEPNVRPNPYARIVIATPETLHARLLRHHDRAWNLFWPRVRLLVLPDVDRHNGIAGAHLADLLLRVGRVALAQGGREPTVMATALGLDDPRPALESLTAAQWRVVSGDDLPYNSTALAVWHGPADRLRESAELALAIQRQGYHVHVLCDPLELSAILPMIGDADGISAGTAARPSHVLIAAGYPGSRAALLRLLRANYQAVVLALGELPHEQMLARHTSLLLGGTSTSWPAPPTNAYVTAQHLLCAASEAPLTEAEVDAWGAREIVDRLVAHEQLIDLPDIEVAWKPGGAAENPYAEFSMASSSGAAVEARGEQGRPIAELDPTGFERWMFPNAALPAGAGGLRVVGRDEDRATLTLRLESNGRRTYPLRRCQVAVREERETRALFGNRKVGWGRVLVDEETYGYREATLSGAPAEVALKQPLAARWIATACWFELAADVQQNGQLIGWSLAAALPLQTLSSFADVAPCYDSATRRLYLVDAQPGGNGLAAWIFARAEELLPLAYDVALAIRNDALLEPLARVDMDWLLPLLGRRAEQPALERAPVAAARPRAEANRMPELIEGPPPGPPRIILTPAPPDATPPPRADEPPQRPAPPVQRQPEPPPRQRPSPRTPPRESQPGPPAPQRRESAGHAATPPTPERPASPQQERLPDPPPRQERPAQPPSEALPDANALIERLRRQRQQREASQKSAKPARADEPDVPVELRFGAGDRVFCLPYGDGVVRSSRAEAGRELLTVAFPDHGDLLIDPAVSLVRLVERATDEDDDLL